MPSIDHAVAFGPFRLFPAQQLLFDGDKPLRLGSRALEILTLLVERHGDLVTKDELVARVWPNTFVEEGNLRVHIAALRRALGDGEGDNRFVATIPGRGYRFVAPVVPIQDQPTEPELGTARIAHNLPTPLARMIGRADVVGALLAQIRERRFITIAGPGGIGKTTVALSVADELSKSYEDGIAFVDLAPVADPAFVPSALASVLGFAIRTDNALAGLVTFLKDKRLLVVLDSCEHVIEAAAALAEELFTRTPGVNILATSREPLRAEGERVLRLAPLGVPAVSGRLSAAEALTFPAVQLFVERVASSLDEYTLSDGEAPIVVDICRRLDGIALAIELAAGCVDAFGVSGLAARLDDRFRLLTRGRRTALPRHQTLSATLDWSFERLPETERVILRRLAVFAGRFTLEAATAVAGGGVITPARVTEDVSSLVAKSLIAADVSGPTVHYRLLETTRAYALAKLNEAGEYAPLVRRYAEYYRDLFRKAEAEWDTHPRADWVAAYGHEIDNVRAALRWAYSGEGDATLGVELTIAAAPLWLQLSLIDECRERVAQAAASLRAIADKNPRRDMQLSAALGSCLIYTSMGPEARTAWLAALELAEELDDTDYKLRSLWGLWVDRLNNGQFREAVALANRFASVAARSSDPTDRWMADRNVGIAMHFLGEQVEARQHIERMLDNYVTPMQASHIVRFQFDQRVTALAFHARILWLLGFPDQALRVAHTSVEEALATGHILSLCNVLGQAACPVTLLAGDLASARRYLTMLYDHTTKHSLGLWRAWGQCFEGALLLREGDDAGGARALRSVLAEDPETRSLPRYHALVGELADAFGRIGDTGKGLDVIDEALARADRNEERWCIAELLRIKGELVLREDGRKAALVAEECFQHGLDWARRQQTLSWELRIATTLAGLLQREGNGDKARETLAPVYGRMTEGFATADALAARALLDTLG